MKTLVIPAKAGINPNRFRIKSGMTMVFLIFLSLLFFWPVWLQGKLPIPADALVGLYHPFRDYFSTDFPNGIPFKNYILTDPVLQQYPWKWLAIRTLLGGESLEESPYSFGGWGASSIENIQAGTFYPLNILFFLINNFPGAWTIFIIIQPILASLFMFGWLKNNGIKQPAAIFGGLVWAFSSFNLVWMEWGNIGHAGLYLPLALLAIDRVGHPERSKGSRRDSSAASGGLRMTIFWHAILQFSLIASLLAGHWQVTLYLLAAVGLYSFLSKKFLLFFAHCFLFVILTSFQWVPAWRFIRESNRQVEQENVLTREGFFIRPRQLVQLISPDFFGNPATGNYRGEWNYSEQVIYVGIIPLVLAILALLNIFTNQTRKDVVNSTSYSIRSLQRFGLILVAVGLIFAVKNPIAEIPYKLNIPIWSDLQPTRLGYLVTFGLSILAVVGMEDMISSFRLSSRAERSGVEGSSRAIKIGRLRRPGFLDFGTSRRPFARNDRNVMVIIGGLGAVFLALLIYSSKLDASERIVSQRNLIWPVLIWGLLGVAGVMAWIFRGLPRPPAIAWRRSNWRTGNDGVVFLFSVFCFLFSVFDLFRFGWKFTPFSPKEYLYPITPAIKFLQNNMRENDRYMTLDRRILPPNANIIYKLKSIEGYDPIYSKQHALLIEEMESGAVSDRPQSFGRIVRPTNYKSPVVALLGVRYVLSMSDLEEKEWVKVFQEGETRIYERR